MSVKGETLIQVENLEKAFGKNKSSKRNYDRDP